MQAIEIDNPPYTIFGTLYKCEETTRKLIINIHGLTHNQWGYLQLNSIAPYHAAGYDCFNFSFYDRSMGSRRLSQSTLSSHKDDLQRVIEHFTPLYNDIYLTGHSLGGLTTLILNPEGVRAVSLWDPAFDVTHFWNVAQCLTPLKEKNAYILDYGSEYVLSADMIEEIKDYPNDTCLKLASEFKTPVQMIIPETSIFLASPHTSPAQYDDAFSCDYERINIAKTDHCFYGPEKDQELFANTLRWFARF